MQDKIRAHARDRAALSDYPARRELATHPQLPQPHHQVGHRQVGRNPRRLRQKVNTKRQTPLFTHPRSDALVHAPLEGSAESAVAVEWWET